MPPIKLSIIIVHHQTPELLRLCLKSLHKNLPSSEINYEIVVIDSQSTRETQDIIYEDFPSVKIITHKENVGYAKGVNNGINSSQGEYILILNPDIVVTPGSIEEMLKFMNDHPKVGILGPQLIDFSGAIQRSYFRFYTPLTILARRTFLGKIPIFRKIQEKFLMADTDLHQVQKPDWIMGSAMMIPRKAIEKVGKMDERFFLYFEDVDWAKRFWENGYTVLYFPRSKMFHYHQRKSKAGFDIFDLLIRRETRWHLKSAVKFFLKHGIRNYQKKIPQEIYR